MSDIPSSAPLAGHFATALQQRRSALLGMWLFLATEIMMFGGIIMGVIVYRVTDSEAMRVAARHLDMLMGGLNTAVLLTSSATIALAVIAARTGAARRAIRWLLATAAFGTVFLAIKAYEYHEEYAEGLMPGIGPPFPLDQPASELFFNLYFAATGLHAVHLTIGMGLVAALTARLSAGRIALPDRAIVIECAALYWHLVDVIWIFLYPIFYLAGR